MLLQHLTQDQISRRIRFKPYNQIIREFIKVSKMLKNNTSFESAEALLNIYFGEASLHAFFTEIKIFTGVINICVVNRIIFF